MNLSDIIHAVEGVEIVVPTPNLGKAALWYATKWSFPVFPCKPRGKAPLTLHGFDDASLDPDQIRDWWSRWPDANIATPTGANGCGFDVVDIDGEPGFASLEECRADLPEILATAFTPGDPAKPQGPGRHLYIAATGDGNSTKFMPGIDYRGAGGYVMVPPSLGPHGVGYAWIDKPAGMT